MYNILTQLLIIRLITPISSAVYLDALLFFVLDIKITLDIIPIGSKNL